MTPNKNEQDEYDPDFSDSEIMEPDHAEDSAGYGGSSLDSDEEWQEGDSAEENMQTRKKKKGGMFNVIVIALGVLLFLGFGYFKFASVPPAPSIPADVAVAEPAPVEAITPPPAPEMSEPVATATVPTESVPPVSGPMSADMAMPPQPTPEFTAAMPATVPVPVEGGGTAPELNLTPSSPSAEAVGVPATPSFVATPDSAPIEQDAASSEKTGNDVPVAVTSPESASETVPMPVFGEQTSASKSESGDLNRQGTEPAQAADAALETSQDSAEILNQLKKLSDRLERLEAKASSKKIVSDEDVTRPTRSESVSALKSGLKSESKSEPAVVAPAPRQAAASPAEPHPRYSLKAVSQGKAYLAQAGRSDLRSVRVGDSLEGIGTIRSIDQVNGRWVVTGTTGKIRQ